MANNPLLDDPSIITASRHGDGESENNSFIHNSSSVSLEPGNALSKLLDSAMANAAKESTPDFEPKSSENSTSSPSSFTYSYTKKDSEKVYSIDFLFSLRNSHLIKNYDGSPELPNKSWWRLKGKTPSRSEKEYGSGSRNQQHPRKQFDWERKPTGFLKNNELDALSNDKISQLLGENNEESVPEWDTDLGSGEAKMNMGQTVEDFENWKSQMRNEERKRKGEVSQSPEEPKGNEVDSFFSFVKPKDSANSSASNSRTASLSVLNNSTESQSKSQGKSSRFSSVFNAPSSSDSTPLEKPSGSRFFAQEPQPQQIPPQVSGQVPQVPGQIPQGPPGPQIQQGPPGLQRPQGQGPPPGARPQFYPQFPPGFMPKPEGSDKTDSFFMSLMSKGQPEPPQDAKDAQFKPADKNIPPWFQGPIPGQHLPMPMPGQKVQQAPIPGQSPGQNPGQSPQNPGQNPQNPGQVHPGQKPPGFMPGMMAPPQNFPYGAPPPGMFPPGLVPPGQFNQRPQFYGMPPPGLAQGQNPNQPTQPAQQNQFQGQPQYQGQNPHGQNPQGQSPQYQYQGQNQSRV